MKIETYRGYDIYFNTKDETFYSEISDTETKVKKSYSSITKAIDDFIKENNAFKPFEVVKNPLESWHSPDEEKLKIIGIRKDGRWVYEGRKKVPTQLSDYNNKSWVL